MNPRPPEPHNRMSPFGKGERSLVEAGMTTDGKEFGPMLWMPGAKRLWSMNCPVASEKRAISVVPKIGVRITKTSAPFRLNFAPA